jgi:hypothetical protein
MIKSAFFRNTLKKPAPSSRSKFTLHYWKWPRDEKIGSWSWLLTKGHQENYLSRPLVTSVKREIESTPGCRADCFPTLWHIIDAMMGEFVIDVQWTCNLLLCNQTIIPNDFTESNIQWIFNFLKSLNNSLRKL